MISLDSDLVIEWTLWRIRLSNAGIAQRLVITEGGVEKHVTSIFTKLGLEPAETDHRRVLAVLRYLEDREP